MHKAQLGDLAYSYSLMTSDTIHKAMLKEFMDLFESDLERGDPELNKEDILWCVIRAPLHRSILFMTTMLGNKVWTLPWLH